MLRRFVNILGSLPRELTIALVVTVVATIIAPPLVAVLTKDKTDAWVVPIAALIGLIVGLMLGLAAGSAGDDLGRNSAVAIQKQLGKLDLAGLDSQTVIATVPPLCLALLDDVPDGDQALLGTTILQIENDTALSAEAKMRMVLNVLAKYAGPDLVERVVEDERALLAIPPSDPATAVIEAAKGLIEPSPGDAGLSDG